MNTTTKIHVAAALAGLASLSGCTLLFRAAKGELVPVGVTQASSSDVMALTRTLGTETDPQAFAKGFVDLASIYMYKCMDAPTMVPREGKSELRDQAGEGLSQAMHARVARFGVDDPVLAAASGDIAALSGKLTKCDEGKRKAQDPSGRFSEAVALGQTDGRAEHVEQIAKTLDGSLEQALRTGDDAVRDWTNDTCGVALPVWGYCVPRAVEGLYSKQRLDGVATVFLAQGNEEAAQLLPRLAAKVGKDVLVGEVRGLMASGKASSVPPTGLDRMETFLRDNGVPGSCNDREALLRAALLAEGSETPRWAITRIVEGQCRNLDDEIIQAMGSDRPWVRQAAAWAVGELKIQKAKKHVDRLRSSDPFLDEGCWCRPVRDTAANAFNKLELEGS